MASRDLLGTTAELAVAIAEERLDGRLLDALEHGVRRVEEEWNSRLEHEASRIEASAQLSRVYLAIRNVLAGREPWLGTARGTTLGRRLVGLIRATFLDEVARLTPLPDTARLLHVLRVVDYVAERLEPESSQRRNWLDWPEGPDLVVEVAHDLRAPLTAILFLAETMKRGRSGPVTPEQERQLGLIYSAAFALSSVASDVIELARSGAGLIETAPAPAPVAELFESVRDIVAPMIEEKGLVLEVQVPPGDEPRLMQPAAVSRILLNLVINAIKFTERGTVTVGAGFGVGTFVHFWVQDTGRGIPPQAMLTLFDPFRLRSDRKEYAFSSAGLGLNITRRLVEALGGELHVESEPGQGTRFSFTLDLPRVSPARRA